MAGRYLDIDPEFALEHAVAASAGAGRIAAVREAVGVAACCEDFGLALRELRTTAVLAARRPPGTAGGLRTCLGRLPKAMEMIAEFKKEELPANVRVELAIVNPASSVIRGKSPKLS